ncbi:glutamate receptor ionotropic, delta-1 [Caerostris darwini]|uniref:Glutamate receptor ionotropic, delta-1 n=1 Tax=Caerostris darwini TaxID=1538125 RepID=A0AAV4R1S5_9ARAC|nr:glutamate receptor ionotropic, delta-1 [Caerostris darwini]
MAFPRWLTVAYLPIKDIFEVSPGETKPKGIEGLFLEILSQTLKFQYRLTSPIEKHWGIQTKDNNWTGLVGMITRGEADIGLAMASITELRKQVVDFSIPYSESHITFVTHFPRTVSQSYAYLYPFDAYIWMGVLITFFAMSLLTFVLNESASSYISIALKILEI